MLTWITFQDIFNEFKNATDYQTLSYNEKRKLKKTYIADQFKKNDLFKEYCVDKIDTYQNGNRIHKCNLLKHYRKKSDKIISGPLVTEI